MPHTAENRACLISWPEIPVLRKPVKLVHCDLAKNVTTPSNLRINNVVNVTVIKSVIIDRKKNLCMMR